MIDRAALEAILVQYKSDFVATTWPEEKYKWQAVKHFQDHWRPDAQDFSEMLKAALGRTENLLVSMNNFPRRMIEEFAEAEPERVRTMFVALFDESNDLVRRVEAFKQESQELLRLHGARSHYQTENAISTYLWLRYPDTHYVYKWSQCRRVSHALGAGFVFKQGDYAANLRDHHEMYDQICEVVRSDAELRTLLDSQLTPDCYPDPEMRTLTGDVAYYVAQMPDDKDEGVDEDGRWWPSSDEYSPRLAVEDWVRLLRDRNVFDEGSMEVVNRLKDIGGRATCRELATRYGRTPQFYNGTSSALAKRVVTATGCPTVPGDEDGSTRWWPVLYTGRRSTTEEDGTYVWRLRDELSQALDQVDALAVSSPADEPTESAGRDLDPLAKPQPLVDYTKQDFLSEVYMPESDYDRLVDVLRRKKNIILQGAPGVGKTFAAKRLAWSMMGMKDPDRIEFVQFHQNYSYEDFVMGYKPSATGFSLRKGVFQTFCTRAADHPDQEFFFIIDEINRGNLSKIFGELLMLIESDHRGEEATLAYDGTPFSVPPNVLIIGMMNTADRSLAMIDYALRRRFSFITMKPGFDTVGFTKYRSGLGDDTLDRLIDVVKSLNTQISKDASLGSGFCIGHSYFCGQKDVGEEWLHAVVDYDILPMLEEYWFDDPDQVESWRTRLHGVLQS